jgi:hypothetical protein
MVPSRQQARSLSRGLGWFSIGLGFLELVSGRPLSRRVGLREIVTGIGLLKADDPTPWVWVRVAGDAWDMAALGAELQTPRRRGAATALAAVAGVTLLDLACARSLSVKPPEPAVDYGRRSGWPLPADEMRGAALVDFTAPRDMLTPKALKPMNGADQAT